MVPDAAEYGVGVGPRQPSEIAPRFPDSRCPPLGAGRVGRMRSLAPRPLQLGQVIRVDEAGIEHVLGLHRVTVDVVAVVGVERVKLGDAELRPGAEQSAEQREPGGAGDVLFPGVRRRRDLDLRKPDAAERVAVRVAAESLRCTVARGAPVRGAVPCLPLNEGVERPVVDERPRDADSGPACSRACWCRDRGAGAAKFR